MTDRFMQLEDIKNPSNPRDRAYVSHIVKSTDLPAFENVEHFRKFRNGEFLKALAKVVLGCLPRDVTMPSLHEATMAEDKTLVFTIAVDEAGATESTDDSDNSAHHLLSALMLFCQGSFKEVLQRECRYYLTCPSFLQNVTFGW